MEDPFTRRYDGWGGVGGDGGKFIVDAAAEKLQGGRGVWGDGGKLYFLGTILPTTAAAPPSPPPHRHTAAVTPSDSWGGPPESLFPPGEGDCALRAPGWRKKMACEQKKTKFSGFHFLSMLNQFPHVLDTFIDFLRFFRLLIFI